MSIDTQANSTPGPSTRRTSRSLRVQVSALILMVTVPLMAITYVVPLVFELRHAREHGGGVPHHGWATWATLGIELAVAGLIAAAVWYVTGRILAPVRSLTRAAERLGSGDWDVGDLPEPDNELGQLTRSFREMAEHLRGTVERTESHIAGRTAELNQAHRNERALRKSLDRERIRLEAVLATIPQGVFWTDLDSVILGCNQALADIYGIDRADDLVGRVDPDDNRAVGHPEAVQACLDDQRVINHGEAMLDYEETYTRADGRTFT
ncbi:MAG: HAMP domain-containing protein, partial [Planctomycetota bacterium]